MKNRMTGCLYRCDVTHRRLCAPRYRFTYRVFSLLLDIQRLPEISGRLRFFSHNRLNLLSLYDRDHGARDGTPLRPWLEQHLARFGIDLRGGRVMLLCMPRVLGYVFNPLSIWYCWHADGELRAVVCEVKNTFGEQHCYLLHRNGAPMAWPLRAERAKRFHVSPLLSMDAVYRFYLQEPAERLRVVIREYERDRPVLVAAQTGIAMPLTDRALLAALSRLPLMTFKVMVMIHWQAFKAWMRGAAFHRKPGPPKEEISG